MGTVAGVGALLSGILGIAGAAVQASATAKAAKASKRAAAERREASKIEQAAQQNKSNEDRRRAVREERIRRSQIIQESINSGTAQSSGQAGTESALDLSLSNVSSASIGQSVANEGINARQQAAADLDVKAQTIMAKGQAMGALFSSIGSLFG